MRKPWILIAALLAVGASCAQERDPINRVQPNALRKSFFVGNLTDPSDDPEFYMRVSIVDADSGAPEGLFTSSDSQPVMRVRWQITEKLLLARLTYERIQDSDYKGARRVPDGQVVAAYTIESQFDIKREYNPTTGEELNVIGENTTDRSWQERDYLRVDWSRNLVTDAYDLDTLSQIGIYYGVTWEPVAYYVSDPNDPDAPQFDEARGYFDITHKAFARPQIIHDPEWGDYPACWLYGSLPVTNCNQSEVTLRQSFLKVVDHDYEPIDYDGRQMEMFGYFTSDRFGYDRRYGVVDDRWHRFATRWNIWDRSHVEPVVACASPDTTQVGQDPHRDVEPKNGTEDECEAVGRGSRCDEFRGECTVPYRDRTVRTIPWYVNKDMAADLFDSTAQALEAWSESLRVSVVVARLAECRHLGESGCEQQMGWPSHWSDDWSPPVGADDLSQVPRIFVLCHNPVDSSKGDDALCGADGLSPRLGDLRFNFINVLPNPQEASPWGIMVDAEDPLTGEKVAGSVNEWGAVLDRAASNLADTLALLEGEIAPTDFIAGKNVSDWVQANKPAGPNERGGAMSAEELASRRSAFDAQGFAERRGSLKALDPKMPAGKRHAIRAQQLIDAGKLGPGNAALTARLKALRGTSLETSLVSPDLAQAAGYDPTGPLTSESIRRASPFGPMNPAMRRSLKHSALVGRAQRHSCRIESTGPGNLLGMARAAAKLFPLLDADRQDPAKVNAHRQQVYDWARREYNRGVLAHELGHSMGLRHNFAASFDSLSYANGYWQLRTHNGTVTQSCPEGTTDGAGCVGPRYRDPLADEEIEGNINRYATSSVMDYPGDQNQDMLLPGKYDRAAVRFGYARAVDVWNAPDLKVIAGAAGQAEAYKLTAFTSPSLLFGIYYFPPVDPSQSYLYIHYSQYQKEFGLLGTCRADTSAAAVLGQKCDGAPMEVVDFRDMQDFYADPTYSQYSWAVNPRTVDAQGRVRRGYLFSSDEFADTGNVPAFTNDFGADAYEQVRFLERSYEERYILDSFRRNRVQFNSEDVSERIQERYLDTIQSIAKTFAFGAVLDGEDLAAPSAGFLDDGYYGPLEVGATVALDLFARILTRPEPGTYCDTYNNDCPVPPPYASTSDYWAADTVPSSGTVYDFTVGLNDGRYLHNDYDYNQGYWWSDYQTQVGTYYEKIWATYYLAEAFDEFISNSKEDFTDSRYKNVNFATVFPEAVRRLYNGLLVADPAAYAPWTTAAASGGRPGLATLAYPAWRDAAALAAARPAGAKPIDPNYGWNERVFAMLWGTMFFPTDWSSTFIHNARITMLPSEKPDWPDAETFAFYDPPTGMTYRAHDVGTESVLGETVQRGAGARMLEQANYLLSLAYQVQVDAQGNILYDAHGQPTLILDADGRAQLDPNFPGADLELKKYVDEIDLFRQLTAYFEQPLDNLPQQ